ncbi:MAG: hypothetical protein DRH11_08670, partial [Deltaproteobacteria bacterium]
KSAQGAEDLLPGTTYGLVPVGAHDLDIGDLSAVFSLLGVEPDPWHDGLTLADLLAVVKSKITMA